MVALEILVNGHHIRTVAVGDVGMLNADITWHRLPGSTGDFGEASRVIVTGIEGVNGDSVYWPDVPCKIGDAITVRIVTTDARGDAPQHRMSMSELEAAHNSRSSKLP